MSHTFKFGPSRVVTEDEEEEEEEEEEEADEGVEVDMLSEFVVDWD